VSLNLSKVKGSGSKPRQPDVDPGTYPARLVQVIDMGVQPQRPFKGEEKPPAPEVYLTYELLDEFLADEEGNEDPTRPRWYSETIPVHNLKADLAKSTKRYKVLDPDTKFGGDFSKLLGTPVNVTLTHNQNKNDPARPYVNIGSTTPMSPKQASKAPELVNKTKVFDLDSPDVGVFKELPEWLQTKITSNLHYEGSKLENLLRGAVVHAPGGANNTNNEEEDEIPW